MLNPEFKTKWLAALRSGEYAQCSQALKKNGGYCCLGVAAVVAGYEIDELTDTVLRPDAPPLNGPSAGSYSALEDFGLMHRTHVIAMNDRSESFSAIADYVERTM